MDTLPTAKAHDKAYLHSLPDTMEPVEKLRALVRWSLERLISDEMPLLPSRNSSLRAVLMANKQYLDGLITVSDQIGHWITEAQATDPDDPPPGIPRRREHLVG